MASNKGDRKKGSMPSGVRGPGGPPSTGASRPQVRGMSTGSTGARLRFEEMSYPMLRRLHAMPRWLIVVLPAVLLFGGLILVNDLSWLGGILLAVVWLFIAWLTALSWPALTPGSRLFRALVVLALGGVVVLKFLGRF
jgi:hypothetical protein